MKKKLGFWAIVVSLLIAVIINEFTEASILVMVMMYYIGFFAHIWILQQNEEDQKTNQ